ncbi:MAG: hypothetical protein PHR00_00660 [Patescibacteria group bacterium]|nr:hypothetical protein [Patescibacteria group bacterium]
MKIIIANPENFEKFKTHIKQDGFQSLHVLSDFDRTITYGAVDGLKTPSIISMLRDGHHLSEGYAQKAHELFDKYHPIEVDENIPTSEKKRLMQEWWEAHNKLLIDSGLSKADLKDIVENGHIKFREGVAEFLDFLLNKNIPLIIFSASGCGDAIQLYFEKMGKNYPNIIYVTNKFNWNDDGKAVSMKGLIIHSMNKDETVLKNIPEVYKLIKDRKNVLLLGDSTGDLGMVEGFDYDNLLTIGFLNFNYNQSRTDYEKKFDIVLEGDEDISFINDLLKDIA